MASEEKKFSSELITIISKSVKEKIYGSVEIFFEAGNITQITQRIIKKVNKYSSTQKKVSKNPKPKVATSAPNRQSADIPSLKL